MIIREETRAYQVLATVVDSFAVSQIPPTLDEIRENVGLKHRSTVHHHVSRLERDGYLMKVEKLARSVKPTDKGIKMVKLGRGEL